MRQAIAALVVLSLADTAQAQGLLSRIFGGRRQAPLQAVSCHQTSYQPAYSPLVYQTAYVAPVAVVVIDPYQYRVDVAAFRSFQEYQSQKQAAPEEQPAAKAAVAQRQPEGDAPAGAGVLKANCMQCHQAGRQPKSGFAIFDQRGELNPNLPYAEMLERISSPEPGSRMPPGKTLPTQDIMAVFRLAADGLSSSQGMQTAANQSPSNPFE